MFTSSFRFPKISAFASLALLALFLALSFLSNSPLTIYYLLLTFGGVILLGIEKKGLYLAYGLMAIFIALFFPYMRKREALSDWGLIYSLALQFYTISLLIEELKLFFASSSPALEEEKLTLEQEIEKLKEEAELRKLERVKVLQSLEKQLLVEKEAAQIAYQVLLEQKNALEQQVEAMQKVADIEKQLLGEKEAAQKNYQALLEQKNALEKQLEAMQKAAELAEKQFEEKNTFEKQLFSEKEVAQKAYQVLLEQKNALEKQLAMQSVTEQPEGPALRQLRQQFEEKNATLSQTRQELFQMESALLLKEKEQAFKDIEISSEEQLLLQELSTLSIENQLLSEEIIFLEGVVISTLCKTL